MLVDLDYSDIKTLRFSENQQIQEIMYLISDIKLLKTFKKFNISTQLANVTRHGLLHGGVYTRDKAPYPYCPCCKRFAPGTGIEIYTAPYPNKPQSYFTLCSKCFISLLKDFEEYFGQLEEYMEISSRLLNGRMSKKYRVSRYYCTTCKKNLFEADTVRKTIRHPQHSLHQCATCRGIKVNLTTFFKLFKRRKLRIKLPELS